jgi:hypothetical protein
VLALASLLRPLASDASALPTEPFTAEVTIEGAINAYGVELHLSFDPKRLSVVDADERDGIQVEAGEFMFQPGQAFIAQNEADNQAGTILFALTRLPPHDPVTGSGVLLRATFERLDEMASPQDVHVTEARLMGMNLADRQPYPIPLTWLGLRLVASAPFRLYLPYAAVSPKTASLQSWDQSD